jgi:long-chain acyl-CoA synthetase
MNLHLAFSGAAQKSPNKPALFWGESEFSYGTLLAQSRVVGQRLRNEFGVRPGDRVGLWLRNCPEFVPALFGTLMAGAASVPINNFLKPDEVSFILADAGVKVLLTHAPLGEALPALSSARPGLRPLLIEDLIKSSAATGSHFEPVGSTECDLAVVVYTSGTTGRPKGAMLSHGNLLHNVESCRQVLAAVEYDRFAVLLPMFHSFMLCVGTFLPLIVGGSIVLVKSVHPLKNALQEIIHRQATILPAIPQLFRALVDGHVPTVLPLRICVSGAAPLPVRTFQDFSKKFPVPLLEGYGLSEASPVVSMNPIPGPWKAGSIGRPIPGVEMSVQDDEGALLAPREVGELCVRGGNVMIGYWNQPAETAKAMRGNWLLTGDIGYRDEDGYFYITDRKKDMLLVNGLNVYPREIEEVIYQIPGVQEAAVVGQPDPRKGEHPVAFVVPGDGVKLNEKSILQYVRSKLADYKVPRRVGFLPALPRNATGKILKTVLRAMPR